MPVEGFDDAKCRRRNRLAALRFNETASVRFGGASSLGRLVIPEGATLLDSSGTLPGDEAEALAAINALLPAGADPLEASDVFVHYCEAASSRFISDRYAFLDGSTLASIAVGGAKGVAFMNSHRTGGFSTESELPFGKTFAGRYEAYLMPDGNLFERSLLGFYMLRGCAPTGSVGPDTDTLDKMIRGGVLQDVSVGLRPGVYGRTVCDVCGKDFRSDDCPHVAGSTATFDWNTYKEGSMTDEEIDRQKARGVPTGRASYTLKYWEIGEVSGVYDGAVPGAGFAKGQSLFTAGQMSERTAVEFAEAFGRFL